MKLEQDALKWWQELSERDRAIYCDKYSEGQFHHNDLDEEQIEEIYQYYLDNNF